MQPRQVKEQFCNVEQYIDNAAQLCQITRDVPDDLRTFLGELDRESNHAKQMLQQEKNDNRIVQCIDRLGKFGDRAMQACVQAGNTVDPQVQAAVRQAHDAISNLMHRLH